jgi:hypothetical protein
VEFRRLAQAEGLWVILRPGPYACAEWEKGTPRQGAEGVTGRIRQYRVYIRDQLVGEIQEPRA